MLVAAQLYVQLVPLRQSHNNAEGRGDHTYQCYCTSSSSSDDKIMQISLEMRLVHCIGPISASPPASLAHMALQCPASDLAHLSLGPSTSSTEKFRQRSAVQCSLKFCLSASPGLTSGIGCSCCGLLAWEGVAFRMDINLTGWPFGADSCTSTQH